MNRYIIGKVVNKTFVAVALVSIFFMLSISVSAFDLIGHAGEADPVLPNIDLYKFSVDATNNEGLNILINKQDSYRLDKGVCNDVMDKVWKKLNTNDKLLSGKKIALLVHGFPAPTPFENRKYLAKLAYNLQMVGYDDVYAVEYPPDRHINETGEALAQLIVNKCVNFSYGQKIDIFAHSMGGLVTRCALEGVLFKGNNPHADNLVAHLVTLGTPHNGLTDNTFKVWLGQKDQEIKYGGKLLENDDLKKNSDFLKALNNGVGQANCLYYQVGSNDSTKPYEYKNYNFLQKEALNNQVFVGKVHDGLIVYDSSLFNIDKHTMNPPAKQRTIGVNHDFLICHDSAFNCLYEWIFNDKWLSPFPIKGAILTRFIDKGGKSYFGYPKSNEYNVVDGRQQDFEKGRITWVQATNVVYTTPAITGAILKYWLANGGRLYIGYPVSVEYSVADGRQQDFEKGTLTWVKNTDTVYMIDKVTPPQPPILTSQSRPLDHIFPTQDGTWLVKKSLFTVKGRSYTWIGYPGMPLVGGKAVFDVSMGHEAFQSDIGVQDDYSGNTYIRIYLDGKEYGNGYWFGKGSKTVSVNVPLQGVKQLRLDRSGYGINGVDFLEPRIITTKPAPLYIPLDGQVPPAQGPYLFFNEHVIHKGKDYHQWAIPGVPRIGGVSTFPVTGYSQFIGYAAMLEGKSCGVSFSIELDGKPVPEFNKRHIAAGDTIIPINVLLNNAKTMTLRTTVDAGNDIFKILDATGDRFVILEPKLFK